MKTTTVTTTFKTTINTGNYSNIILEQSITAELEDTDTLAGVQAFLFSRCRNAIAEELANQVTLATSPNKANELATTLDSKALASAMPQWNWIKAYAPHVLEDRFGSTESDNDTPPLF